MRLQRQRQWRARALSDTEWVLGVAVLKLASGTLAGTHTGTATGSGLVAALITPTLSYTPAGPRHGVASDDLRGCQC